MVENQPIQPVVVNSKAEASMPDSDQGRGRKLGLKIGLLVMVVLLLVTSAYFVYQNFLPRREMGLEDSPSTDVSLESKRVISTPEVSFFRGNLFIVYKDYSEGISPTIHLNLFDFKENKLVRQKEINLNDFPYSLTVIPSRFGSSYSGEPIKMTNDGSVYMVLVDTAAYSIGGEIAQNKDMPYNSAIFKTDLTEDRLLDLVYQTDQDIRNVEYVPEKDVLVFTTFGGPSETNLANTFWKLDLNTKQTQLIAKLDKPQNEDQTLAAFKISGNKILQLVRYSPHDMWIDNRLELLSIDIDSGSIEKTEVFAGDGIEFDDSDLSADERKIVFEYTYDRKNDKGVMKDLAMGEIKEVPNPTNSNYYWLSKSEGYVYAQGENWYIYDLGSQSSTVIEDKIYPLDISTKENKIVGLMEKQLVIYDLDTKKLVYTGIEISHPNNLDSVEWK